MNPWLRLREAWDERPDSVTAPVLWVFPGLVAIILGDGVSKAFENLGSGTSIRILGVALVVGGLTVLVGILRKDTSIEMIGLLVTVFGSMIYGVGVVMGLGWQGIMAGGFALGPAVGFLGRCRCLVRKAPDPQ